MTLAHYFSGSMILPETLAAYRRHGRNSFSTLPVLGSWGGLAPDNGQTITRQNFAAMLAHVRERHDAFASIFGRRRVRKFCRAAQCFLAIEAVRITVSRIVTSLRIDRSAPKPEPFRGTPELSHND
jgi:hypothetical protein